MTSSGTRLLGAIGYPNRVARTPVIMSIFAENLHLDYAYLLFEFKPQDLRKAVEGLKALGAVGFNVTMPYKRAIMEYLDEVDEEAEKLGAVNTVAIREGKMFGYNTDYYGFRQSLHDSGINVQGKRVAIIGAGAVSGPVSLALVAEQAEHVSWLNRTADKARACAEQMNNWHPGLADWKALDEEALNREIRQSDLIIDITPVGMATNAVKQHTFDVSVLNESKTVYHVVYAPWETPILQIAREHGAKAVNGARMSLNQAKRSFEIWTGAKIELALLQAALQRVESDVCSATNN